MDKKNILIPAAGLLLLAVIFYIDYFIFQDIYFTGICVIIFAVIGMSLFIMYDAATMPDIGVSLKDDARGVVIVNRGNDTAYNVHVALVPHNIEFDIASLAADAIHDYPTAAMLTEAKAVITYKNVNGDRYSKTTILSALGEKEDDLLKPMLPLFQWK